MSHTLDQGVSRIPSTRSSPYSSSTPPQAQVSEVVSLFPREAFGAEETTEEVAEAMEDCEEGEVQLVDDSEVGAIIEIVGHGKIKYKCASMMPFLFLYAKAEGFFQMDIDIVDVEEKYFKLSYANRRSLVHIDQTTAELPMLVSKTWQRLKFDLRDAVAKAFGTTYFSTVQITIYATCRIFRLYMAKIDADDLELPSHLQVLPAPPEK